MVNADDDLCELDWDSITCVDEDGDWDSITCVDEDGETLVDLNFLPFSEVVNADDDICELDWDSITCVDEDGETLVDLNFLPFSEVVNADDDICELDWDSITCVDEDGETLNFLPFFEVVNADDDLCELDWDSITCVDEDGKTLNFLRFSEVVNADDDICELDWDSITCVDEDGETLNFLRFSEVVNADDDICELDWDSITCVDEDGETVLVRSTVLLDVERLYGSVRFVSREFDENEGEGDGEGEGEGSSFYRHERGASLGCDVCFDLMSLDAVDELKDIADRMIKSGYEKECCQVYCNMRREVLDECLVVLGVERLSIEEVQCVDWKVLDEKLKKWILAVKVVVRVLLFGEKRLCEQVFNESELIQEVCFVETTKGCVMQFLNFGEAVAISQRSPEKLFRILDMYEVLVDVSRDLEALYASKSGGLICSEAKGVLSGMGMAGVGTFVEFENAVKGESSRDIQGGDINPITRYVMNYLKLLVDYSDTLNTLLPNNDHFDLGSSHLENGDSVDSLSPIACHVQLLITSLDPNIDEKSKLYEDSAMGYVFIMNNILYIVQKVKESDLRSLLGDQWIHEGIGDRSSSASKVILKERFKSFNPCFEDIYRIQTVWKVPDEQLREELRIFISEKVLPAYRSFLGRFGSRLEGGRHGGKYIKYYPDDLENYLSDLFEGKPIVMNHMKRKNK
ncbi:exocyst complex component EXO70B1 [Tanacetum coccineum]